MAVYANRLQPLFVLNLYVPGRSNVTLPPLAVALAARVHDYVWEKN